MKRVFHNYLKWEDFKSGMWDMVSAEIEDAMLPKAIKFTGDTERYGSYMARIPQRWPIACEHNLTNSSLNQQAWIGHAAACLAIKCPEYITRRAWSHLTDRQRDDANVQAQSAIDMWREAYVKTCAQIALEWKSAPFDPKNNRQKIGKWVSDWESKGYWNGIPDEAPENLERGGRVPSYRLICMALMKNDHTLQALGFSRPECALYNELKRVEIAARSTHG